MFIGTHFYYKKQFADIAKQIDWKPSIELYEVFRVVDGIPLFLNAHMCRLSNFFAKKSLPLPYQETDLLRIIFELIQITELINGNIRISFDLSDEDLDMTIGQVSSFYPSDDNYRLGVKGAILHAERSNPELKIYQKNLRENAQTLIKETGSYDVILCNIRGELTEGSRTNVFFIKGDELYTSPQEQVLPGITRQVLFEICGRETIPINTSKINQNFLEQADAAFFTGTSPGVLPISEINSFKLKVNNPLLLIISRLYQMELQRDLSELSQKMSKK